MPLNHWKTFLSKSKVCFCRLHLKLTTEMVIRWERVKNKLNMKVAEKICTTSQVPKQIFWNMSYFYLKKLQSVKFETGFSQQIRFPKNLKKLKGSNIICVQKVTFWLNILRKIDKVCVFRAVSENRITKYFFVEESFLGKIATCRT